MLLQALPMLDPPMRIYVSTYAQIRIGIVSYATIRIDVARHHAIRIDITSYAAMRIDIEVLQHHVTTLQNLRNAFKCLSNTAAMLLNASAILVKLMLGN